MLEHSSHLNYYWLSKFMVNLVTVVPLNSILQMGHVKLEIVQRFIHAKQKMV